MSRTTPELTRSCRLAIDLPLLGVLTWLCGGAKSPRRSVSAEYVVTRCAEFFPALVAASTPRQRAAAFDRLRRAGLLDRAAGGELRPLWHPHAQIVRLDVAVWRRDDLSVAAKRVHAVFEPRIAAGRSDSVEWLSSMVGMSRGRAGEALRELEAAGLFERAGSIRTRRGVRARWSTGTQSEGVPKPIRREAEAAAAPPMTPAPASESRTAVAARAAYPGGIHMDAIRNPAAARRAPDHRTAECDPSVTASERFCRDLLTAVSRGADVATLLHVARVATPWRPLTAAGARGLHRIRIGIASELTRSGTTPGTVAAWLIEHVARGLSPARAVRSMVVTLGWARGDGCRHELEAFVKRTGAERHLPTGARGADVTRATSFLVEKMDVPEEGDNRERISRMAPSEIRSRLQASLLRRAAGA